MERLLKITDELETNLLSGLLLDPSELPKVSEIVRPEDLSPQAAMVYGAMQEIAASDTRQLDKLTLYSKLEKSGGLDAAGGAEYLDYIGLFTPASPNLAYYALVIRDKALRRRIKEVGKAVAGLAEVWHGKAEELLDEAEKRLGELRGERRASSWITAKQTMLAAVKRLEELYAKGATISGIATGLRDLDLALGGLHAGELIILAARPAMGKTALALQIAKHVAKEKHGVGIFSLEMTHDELTPRMLANEARIDGQAMRSGRLSETHWSKLTMAIDVLLNTGLHIDDTLITSVFDMRTKARTLEQKLRGRVDAARAACGRLPPARRPVRRRARAGDRRHLARAQGAGQGAAAAGPGAQSAQPRVREAEPETAPLGSERQRRRRAGRGRGAVHPPRKRRGHQGGNHHRQAAERAGRRRAGHVLERDYELRGFQWENGVSDANHKQIAGSHYVNKPIQAWDFIHRNGIGYLAGNVIKYVSRYDAKGGLEDLQKARHYIDKLIEEEQNSSESGDRLMQHPRIHDSKESE
jgi:replicative DNA helicase